MISYKFGDFRLDIEKQKLLGSSDKVIPLTPRVFDLLLFLVENAGRVLTKDELLETIWVDCIVEEANLSQDIFILRKALKDSSKHPHFIRTIPGSGYSFISPVTFSGDKESDEAEKTVNAETILTETDFTFEEINPAAQINIPEHKTPAVSGLKKIKPFAFTMSFAVFSLILLLFIAWNYLYKTTADDPINSIAVLPFTYSGNDENINFLTNGLTQNITNRLARLQQIKVLANSTTSGYDGKDVDPLKVGRELNVGAVLVGRLKQEGHMLDVHVELIEVSGGKLLWGENYKHKLSDLIILRDEITQDVYINLNLQISNKEEKQLTKRPTNNAEAFQFYLRGRHYLNKQSSRNLPEATKSFLKAVSLDPDYCVAYSGLAMSYLLSDDFGFDSTATLISKAKDAANKALILDKDNEEALTILAFIAYRFEFNWTKAETLFKRAIGINPNNITAHQWFGEFLNISGRTREGLEQQQVALDLDPYSPHILMDMAVGHYLAKRFDEAVEYANRVLEKDSDFVPANYYLSEFYQAEDKFAESAAEWQKALLLEDVEAKQINLFEKTLKIGGYQNFLNEKVKWLEERQSKKSTSPTELAKIYAALDNKDKAIFWLEEGLTKQTPDIVFIRNSPAYDKLRDDERFQEILRRINL